MTPRFDEFWAIDWSGAREGYRGIAIARCRPGRLAPELVAPPAGASAWTRSEVLGLVRREAARRRLLVGLDFAFGFPGGSSDLPASWAEVDRHCRDDADFYAGGYVRAMNGMFWVAGKRPAHFRRTLRLTDDRCRARGGVEPETIYKLIGPKQVGRAALAGMRVLHELSARGGPIEVWPSASPPFAGSVVVEIFPTLFRRAALGGTGKIRSAAALDRALAHFGSATAPWPRALSDDATDAIVSAAALRDRLRRTRAAAFATPADARVRREGWIFGVAA